MPRAVDPGPPPIDYNPLQYQGLEVPGKLDMDWAPDLGQMFVDWIKNALFGWLDEILGFDFNQWVLDLSGLWDWIPKTYNDFVDWLNSMWSQAVDWFNGLIPIGWLTPEQPNLLEGIGAFPNIQSITANPWWKWDPGVTVTPDGTGSAFVDADGTTKALRSMPVTVAAKMPVNVEISLRWQNLVATAPTPLKLQIIPILGRGENETELPPVTIAEVENPAPDNGWMVLKGEWTTPAAGVDGLRMRLFVENTAMAGRIHWDHGIIKRTGTIPQGWITDLLQDWLDLFNSFGAATMEQLNTWVKNLLMLFGLDELTATQLLTWDGARQLIDKWVIPSLQETIDGMYAGFASMGIVGEWINRSVYDVATWVYGIFDTGLTANNRIADLIARLNALEGIGTGNNILDEFNRKPLLDWLGNYDIPNSHPGPDWTLYRSGPGGATIGIKASAQTSLGGSSIGGGTAGCIPAPWSGLGNYLTARHNQAMDTSNGHISVVFTSKIETGWEQPRNYLICRCNEARTNYIEAVIQYDQVWLRHWDSGVSTDLVLPGAITNVFSLPGDLWELLWGVGSEPHRYVLMRNGIVVLNHLDRSGPGGFTGRAAINSAHRYVGFGYEATMGWLLAHQAIGASLGVFSATDIPSDMELPEVELPYTESNLDRVNEAVPDQAVGCWVTLVGGGGAGGGGYIRGVGGIGAGGGGGGGARIDRTFIPRDQLGTHYTISRGQGGSQPTLTATGPVRGIAGTHTDGTASVFSSGAITYTAGGGKKGHDGDPRDDGNGGQGGVATGADPAVIQNGTAGGQGAWTSDRGQDNPNGGGPGGGGGSGYPLIGGSGPPGRGGNATTALGGIAVVNGATVAGANAAQGLSGGGGSGGPISALGVGQNGGDGGASGAGGGGGGGSGNNLGFWPETHVIAGGKGGPGFTRIEWV